MKFRAILMFAFIILSIAAYSQSKAAVGSEPPSSTIPLSLELKNTVRSQFARPINGDHVACDEAGNLYARRVPLENMTQQAPVQQIKPDGSLGRSFNVTDASPDMIFPVASFFVGAKGEVYIAAWSNALSQVGNRNIVLSFGGPTAG